jgi:hypothetical protein
MSGYAGLVAAPGGPRRLHRSISRPGAPNREGRPPRQRAIEYGVFWDRIGRSNPKFLSITVV